MHKLPSFSRWYLLAVGVGIAALIAAACGGAAEPTATPRPATQPTTAPAAPQPTAAPAVTTAPAQPTAAPTVARPQPTTAPPPAGVKPSGAALMAQSVVNPMIGDPSLAPYRDWEQSGNLGITEYLFVMENGDPMTPHLATSWEVATDGSKVTIGVRQGIPWNSPPGVTQNFGNLTAHDVVWFINKQNAFTNPESTSGDAGDFAAVFKEARVIDDYKFEIDLATPTYFGLPLSQFGILSAAPSIRSKSVFDKMGRDWMIDHAVGTGPYVQKEWVNNERGVVEAIDQHWKDTATVKTFTVLQVPENSSRVAMVKAGQADLAVVDFKLVPGLVKEGLAYIITQPDEYVGVSAIWSGNLWEEFHHRTGQPLEPWKAPSYARDYPWIGNPWGNRVPYTDTDNPAGMDDMEQARLVRLALSYAIDREGINEKLLGGMGTPIYSEYMGPKYPGWDPKRMAPPRDHNTGEIISNPGPTQKPVPWQIEYDPDLAKELLKAAGYPNGFEITLQSYACEIGEACLEVADIVTSAWGQVGLKVTQKREDYGGVISPRMRVREQVDPIIKNGDVNSNQYPLDWPYPPVDTSRSRPGWGVAFESKYLADNVVAISGSRDRAFREQKHLETADYMLYWQLYDGLIQIPVGILANPNRVKSWLSRPQHYVGAVSGSNPQFLRLVGQ